MTQGSSKYVFISYNRRDEAVMRRIVNHLRGSNINVWVDNEKLVPGTPIWEEEIEKAIRGAFAVVVILSPASKNSEWVRREVTLVDNSHKRVFPVLITGGEEDAIPIRLITRQFVDLRKNEEAGLRALSEAISQYREELGTGEAPSVQTAPQKPEPAAKAPAEPARSPAMEEVIRAARERERIQRTNTGQKPAQKKSNPLVWLVVAGGILMCAVLVTAGPLVWKALTTPPTLVPTSLPNENNNNNIGPATIDTAKPTDTPTDIPNPPTATFTFTPSPTWTPSPTFTFTPPPSITPYAPTDPSEFIVFYFDTIVFQKDYQKCWSLQTSDYQTDKSNGWNNFVDFWSTVKNWSYSSISTEYNTPPRARVLITFRLYYQSGSSDLVDGNRYCLLWNDSINTWQIDLRDHCP